MILLIEALMRLDQSSTLRQSLFYLFFFAGEDSRETDEVAKELEHAVLQNTMDKEMHELNKRLKQTEV